MKEKVPEVMPPEKEYNHPQKDRGLMKGIAGYIIFLGVIIALQILIFSTFFHKDILRERSFIESYYLVKGSQLDTYVKAYLLALQTSLLQGIYDTGCKKDKVWQHYGENKMPTITTLEKEMGDKTELYSNISLDVLKKNDKGIIVPPKNKVKKVEIGEKFATAYVYPLSFEVKKREINISYTFSPEVKINTSFKKIYEKARELIDDRKIKELVEESIQKVRSDYNLKDKYEENYTACGGCPTMPTCEQLFKEKTGYTFSQIEELIKDNITWTTASFFYGNEFLKLHLYPLEIKSDIDYTKDYSCSDTGRCCDGYWDCVEYNETTGECMQWQWVCTANYYTAKLTCYYYYYGAERVLVNITENPYNYFTYTLFDNCERKQAIQDNLRLNFQVIDGNIKF